MSKMLWSKDRSHIQDAEKFVYEISTYLKIENVISLESIVYIESEKFLPDKTVYDKRTNLLKFMELSAAPISWLEQSGYKLTPIDVNLKSKFKRKLK